MERFKKNTLTNVYYQSRNVMILIYIILILSVTFMSDSKVTVFIFATSIPVILLFSEYIHKTREWNLYYITIPISILLATNYELNTTLDESFWLYFLIIIYHTILFIDKTRYKLMYTIASVLLVIWIAFYLGYPTGVIVSQSISTIIFTITTYVGFGYLLDKQTEVLAALHNKDEVETLLKAYAGDLEKKNSELDQFAYIVSHDLKAPLRGINNLSTWIEEDLGSLVTEDARKNFTLLHGRVVRMENLINGILAYSRAGRIQTEEAYFSTYELVNDICTTLTLNNPTDIHIVQPLPFIKSEKVKLEQVFSNLISNAIKYNKDPYPEITITATENDTECCFCVADNGPGINPAYHEKIFVIFQTLQSRDTLENTGVGLAIVKKIVEENGGKVWLESTLGSGSNFYFTWPK
ncbi:MAG: ATP-binding protein [Bacteroidota bacterium]